VKYHSLEPLKFSCLYLLELNLNCTRLTAKKAMKCNNFECCESERRLILPSGHHVMDRHATVSITAKFFREPSERQCNTGLACMMRWS
jgi:hypothetical protein